MKTVIIGGVAAGASCAARLRRLDEKAEIVLLERGRYISYANCGLPYHIGGVIRSRDALLVTKTETMEDRFDVDVRTGSEVIRIDRGRKNVIIWDEGTEEVYSESYDKLVIATGSSPVRPPTPGIDHPRIMTLWTVPDADVIREMIGGLGRAKSVIVIGGGFIGIETAENLRRVGLSVTIVEAMDQVMAPFDPGFSRDIVSWCRRTGNTLLSNEKDGVEYIACIQKGTEQGGCPPCVPDSVAGCSTVETPQGKTIIVFDGDMDKVLASFIIANGALAMGRPVTMFFTFWGLTALRKTDRRPIKKKFMEKMFDRMLPRGPGKLKLSKMNMGGIGTAMMRSIMKDKNIDSLEELMKKAMDAGVKIIACSMSMVVMGIREEELIDGVEIGGVGTYLGEAEESNVNLFI